MKVVATITFLDGAHGLVEEGQTVTLPRGVDWLKKGLVQKVTRGSNRNKRTERGASDKRTGEGVASG